MYHIPIDEQNYHINSLTKEELLWGETTCKRVLKRYSKLKEFVSQTMSPLNLNEVGRQQLLTSITIAFSHAMKHSKPPITQEQLDKTLKSWINAFLPYIVQNLLVIKCSHPIQFEPIALTCHYVTGAFRNAISEQFGTLNLEDISELELYILQEFCNLLRAISSSVMLLSIGDDVHGASIYRGSLEIFSKLILAQKFPEEYVLFKKFNFYLQRNKQNGVPLPSEMIDFLKNEPLYTRNPEHFLAYGWAKDSCGNRILSMKQLISNAMSENIKEVKLFLQLASEFTHEDYVGIEYDYISIRKTMMDFYYFLLKAFTCEDVFCDFISSKLLKAIQHLQNLADPIYTGEFLLPRGK